MAIEYLKKGLDEKQRIEDNDKVKKIVEETLSKIESEGDKYVRELSQKFERTKLVLKDGSEIPEWLS